MSSASDDGSPGGCSAGAHPSWARLALRLERSLDVFKQPRGCKRRRNHHAEQELEGSRTTRCLRRRGKSGGDFLVCSCPHFVHSSARVQEDGTAQRLEPKPWSGDAEYPDFQSCAKRARIGGEDEVLLKMRWERKRSGNQDKRESSAISSSLQTTQSPPFNADSHPYRRRLPSFRLQIALASSQLRMTRNPIYDYPDPYANPRCGALASPRKISLVGRLRLTQPVWLQLGINSATALHILQREPPGTFLVRRSNTRQCHVLCLRLPDKSSPAFVTTYCLRQELTVISLEGSDLTFPSLLHLIASYCSVSDILPLSLRLPQPIWEASSCQHLEAIAHLGLEFWNSSLNSRVLFRPVPLVPLPGADMDPPLDAPPTAAQEQSCKELTCEKPTRTCGLPNPSFAEVPHRDVGVRRQYFKNSIKVRVSTEAASPLSPPAAPPPPIPVGKKKNLPRLPQSPAPGAGGQPASQTPLPRVPSQATDSYHTPCSQRMVKEKNSLGPRGAPGTAVSASGQMLCVGEEEQQPGVPDKAADPDHAPQAIEEGRLGNGVGDCTLSSREPA